jgi:hypothetical protein
MTQNSMLTDAQTDEIKYVVKVNGQVRSAPLPRALAESFMQNLPVTEQSHAQLVPATSGGQEILLG